MPSGALNGKQAIQVNIAIMRTIMKLREIVSSQKKSTGKKKRRN